MFLVKNTYFCTTRHTTWSVMVRTTYYILFCKVGKYYQKDKIRLMTVKKKSSLHRALPKPMYQTTYLLLLQ